LLESELFGHEKGAFTGAVMRRPGRFERASGGTLFLDEIADMSPALQAKILRVVQEQQVERVGGTTSLSVDVRLLAATKKNLRAAIERGEFREDLYYRIAVLTLRLPSLAERADDMLLLISHFVRRFAALHGKRIDYICDRALIALQAHSWPGNVRELRNVIERAVLLADGDTLTYRDFQPDAWQTNSDAKPEVIGPTSLEEVEARHIARVLQETGGSVTDAARVLGIHRNSLARKIRRYGL
jgi:DNA-binding NtrC family response regulator